MIRTIVDSRIMLDGGAMNGIVPLPLWSRPHPPDSRGRIQMVTRTTLFSEEDSDRTWLVETGMGDGWDEKQMDIYAIEKIGGGLVGQLRAMGISPEDVTDLILTHLHFDHAAGTLTHDKGQTRLTFPKANIFIQRSQMDWALSPSIKDAGSYRSQDVEYLASCPNVVLLDGSCDLSESVSVTAHRGHTEGMQTVAIREKGQDFVVAADLVPLFSHVRIPWIMAYDNEPVVTVREKTVFLKQAAGEGWIVISVHDAEAPAAKIEEVGENQFRHAVFEL
jgi:glyoxylase-like metal-dependent hydrolase (beta-lactamase superfamily II)